MSQRINNLRDDISKFIINWNSKFPIDYWWRNKYKIPFGSKEHRETDFIKMFIDYEEEKMINELKDKYDEDKEREEEGEFAEIGKPSSKTMSKKEIDTAFDDIDLNKFNK